LGILLALAELVHALGFGPGCSREEVLDWVIELEGHPDNAVASCLGGMGICSRRSRGGFGYTRLPVGPELQWVALVPELELSTEAARKLLPKEVPFRHAVENMQNAARLAVCLGTGRYEELEGLFSDHLHQPYRQVLIPGFQEILESSRKAGALGGFLSGAGSTLMAVVLKRSGNAESVADAMLQTAKLHGLRARILTLEADNDGARVV
jgi:homoserine kinase